MCVAKALPCLSSNLSFMMTSPVPEASSVRWAVDSGELEAQCLSSTENRLCPSLSWTSVARPKFPRQHSGAQDWGRWLSVEGVAS